MNTPTSRMFAGIIALAAVACPSRAEEKTPPSPRTITVSGQADIKVVPDQVAVFVGIETFAASIAESKAANDARVKTALELAAKFQPDPKQIQTGQLSLAPRYEYKDNHYNYEKVVGYETQRHISILLTDASRFEAMIAGLLEAGINRVERIEFRTSQLRAHRDTARSEALKAARKKASDMAAVLDQKVGLPLNIVEEAGDATASWRFDNRSMTGNTAQFSQEDGGAGSDGFAPGVITIRANVSVTFGLQ